MEGNPDAEDLLGKQAQGDQSLNMSGKFDERASLLPDGTRADKAGQGENGNGADDTFSAAKINPEGGEGGENNGEEEKEKVAEAAIE